jgi:Arc/MetJ-type ribon-helix-helix transcriptional regulator
MTITIRPKHERLIAEAIRSGRFQNPDDVIGRALETFQSEEDWLLENRDEIDQKIERGLA